MAAVIEMRTDKDRELMCERILAVVKAAGGKITGRELDALFPGEEPEMWFACGLLWADRKLAPCDYNRDWPNTVLRLL